MTVDARLFTADELLRLPDDGHRYELLRGELRKMSPAGHVHGAIGARICAHLQTFVEAMRLGEVYTAGAGFLLARNPDTVLAPDVAFVRAERLVPEGPGYFPGPPDLAIEVISPTDLYSDVAAKTREWLRAGTRAVIVVDPRSRTADVHRASGSTRAEQVLEAEDVVPGWKMPLDRILTSAR